MKLWHVVLLIIVLGGGATIIAQEVRYRDQLEAAHAQADTLEQMQLALDSTLERLTQAEVGLEAERSQRDSAQAVAEATIEDLELGLRGQREQTQLLEAALRERVPIEDQGAVDSLAASHDAEVGNLEATLGVVTGELRDERALRIRTDSVLAATRTALDECLCTLETAQATVDAFTEVTDGRGWASRAWDSVTSPRGLLTIGVVGLAAYGAWQILSPGEDPAEPYYREQPTRLSVDVQLPWR